MITLAKEREQRRGDGAHSGAEDQPRLCALQPGKRSLHYGQGRVPVARVEHVAIDLEGDLLVHVGGLERRRKVDGRSHRPICSLPVGFRVNRSGG